ncbi:cytochrome P450 [Hymenopellis radicata]|nr:cytochrome P450 [Hymenopellis radicata]
MSSFNKAFFTPPNAVIFKDSKVFELVRTQLLGPWGILFGCFALAFFAYNHLRLKSLGTLPPGPKGLPVVGNLFDLYMADESWITFTKWKKTYGDLIYLNVAGQSILVLNSHKVTADLMDRRATIYSDRPRWIVASEILTGGLLVVFSRYGDVWRRMRRAAHEGVNKSVAPTYQPLQIKEAVFMVDGLIKDDRNWDEELRRAAASMIMSVVYDAPIIEDCHDPSIGVVNTFVERLARSAFPGEYLVEFFPWMRYLPSSIAKWKRDAENHHKVDSVLFQSLYDDVEKRVDNGDVRPSFTATLVKEKKRHGLNQKEAAWLSATLYAAGSETTAAVLEWFMVAMVKYPEIQKKCQEELDAVVGRSRMPTYADREFLPYISATVRECLRWKPIDPVGLPHRLTQDDWYEGYWIPKGTIVMANIWGMNMDPTIYGQDAADFNPGRHITPDGKLAKALADTKDGHLTFGFGRRLCIGRHVATNSLFIDIACILWALNVDVPKDAAGKRMVPDSMKYFSEGLVLRPLPFRCILTPRFPEAPAIVAETKAQQFDN